MSGARTPKIWTFLALTASLMVQLMLVANATDAGAQTRPLRVAPVWRATLSTGPDTRLYVFSTVKEAYGAYAAWVVNQVLPPVRVVVSADTWPCSPQTGFYNGVPYAYCHHYERWYGTTLELSTTTGAVTTAPLCPEDYRLVYVVPPPGGSPFNVRVVCESWYPPRASQCPPNSCNALGNPIFPEDATKRQVDVDYVSPSGPLSLSRTFNSSQGGGFFHSFQFPVRKAYDLGELADGTANVTTGCLSSHVRLVDGDGTIRRYPYCFTYITDDAQEGRVEIQAPSGLVMQMDVAGNAIDAWNAGSRLERRTVRSSPGYALLQRSRSHIDYYDSQWLLSNRLFPDGQQLILNYTGRRLDSVADHFGRQLRFGYDGAGRLVSMIDPGGGVFQYSHASINANCLGEGCQQIASVTYPDQKVRVYHWNEAGNVSGSTYGRSLLTGVTDELSQRYSTFKYLNGNATSTELAGSVLRYQVTQFQPEYTTIIDPLGSSRTYKFAAHGGLTRLWNVTSWCPNCLQFASYDTNGNQTAISDFNNNTTCFAYDSTRNLETKRVEGAVGSGSCLAALTSPPLGSRVVSTQWHPDWRLETRIAEPKKLTTIVYNGQGATCAPDTVLVDGKPPAVVCSRTEQATTDETGAAGFAAAVTGTARTWSYTYTTYGRVLTATDPNGAVTTYTYHPDNDANLGRRGNVATITNALGHVTRITAYNAHGQPTRIIDPNNLVTDLTYDLRMRLTRRKVGNESTSFVYDAAGQLTRMTLPDGARLTYTYDAAQRLTAIADHKGNKVVYTLDAMGNRINEKLTDPGGVLVRNIQRSIDALNRVQQVTGIVSP